MLCSRYPYKYSYGSFKFYNLHLIHCLPKVVQHAFYMLNSVLFANLYSSQLKGLRKTSLNEEQTFYFQLHGRHFIFSLLLGNKPFF